MAKFVRVTQTGRADGAPAWSVLNMRIYEQNAKVAGTSRSSR